MIRGYSDHAANERTFLAWVRTGIAVIAFGFVIEKFNLFLQTMALASNLDGSFNHPSIHVRLNESLAEGHQCPKASRSLFGLQTI